MRGIFLMLVGLALGLAVGTWYGTQHASALARGGAPAPPNNIRFVVESNTKVDLQPSPGDVITWVDSKGKPLNVNIGAYPGQPYLCTTAGPSSTCVVAAPAGIYPYSCVDPGKCFDPAISPGKYPGPFEYNAKHQTKDYPIKEVIAKTVNVITTSPTPVPVGVQVYCDPNSQKAKAAIDPLPVSSSSIVEWEIGGTVTGYVTLPPNTCQNQNGNNQYGINVDACTIADTLLTNPQTYQIHLVGCTDGTGQIQRTP